MPDKCPTLLQPAASVQLGLQLVEIRVLLTMKSWEKSASTAFQPAQNFGH